MIINLHVHRFWISLLIEFSSKTVKRNITGKIIIRYLCFIRVDFIHSCHHRLKKHNFILEKKQISCSRSDLLAIDEPLRLRFLTALNTSSWNVFWSNGDSSHFQNFPSFQISWICSDVFQIKEKFIHNCPPCSLAEMAKVASSVARPRKCYINRLERFIFNELTSVFYASVLLLIMNFVITMSK